MAKNYYMGLDVGSSSVGWAVTDEEYRLCNFRKKDMWGIRLFTDAETAKERRIKRNTRHRTERVKERIDLLQDLFAEEMSRVDETFFIRLNESRLHQEDKSVVEKYPLFVDKSYCDVDYYKEYPTIFHLRKELISNDKAHDIRLVYLALHHIIKNRGHFLLEGDLNSVKDFGPAFDSMIQAFCQELNLSLHAGKETREKVKGILENKTMAKSKKAKLVSDALKEVAGESEEENRAGEVIPEMAKLMVGNQGDISKILGMDKDDFERAKFSFADSNFDDEISTRLEEEMPEQYYLVLYLKAIYDWNLLADILQDEEYVSFAKVAQYEKHAQNLKTLRYFIRKYCDKNIYRRFFDDRKSKDNYAAYIGMVKKNGKKYTLPKARAEDFYKGLEKLLKTIVPEEEDVLYLKYLLEETGNQTLLPLQRTKDNGVIPRQVHENELKKILENAEAYLPFLKRQDREGICVREKIEYIFRFRIPYFVGPLSSRNGGGGWAVRKEEGRIYPWNIERMIDYEQSNEEFIRRMTNKCTYLIGEDVLPKNSLLYSRYMVLNEINNLRVRGEKITVQMKQDIFRDLFMEKTKVRGKDLLLYLKRDLPDIKEEDLSGFDGDFQSSLKSYLDFSKNIFGERMKESGVRSIAEDIIRWSTIYGNDKKMLKKMIRKKYSQNQISEEELKKILGLKYAGWGNFSKKFLTEIEGASKEDGEVYTMIDALWETNHNLMQLLSTAFTFKDMVEEQNQDHMGELGKISYDTLVKDLYLSPANKRAVWQTIQIAEEVRHAMGQAPKRIFVEMARGGAADKKGKRTQSRKQKLLDLYKNCKDDSRNWYKEIEAREEREFNSMKLYLYYTQMGRCMYTEEAIDIEALMQGNSNWDRDHIYPQSKIKDDSIDNLVLVKKNINSTKDKELLSADIRRKRTPFWRMLLEKKFISKEKYDRLTRRNDFTEEELTGFISRQLVETRQSTKAIVNLLGRMYPESEVIPVKASLVSDFRKKPLHMLKSRRVNDYHHAHDAYLNIVVGNVYNARFTSNPLEWMKKNRDSNYSLNAVFKHDVYRGETCVWHKPDKKTEELDAGGTLDLVRQTMKNQHILYTEYTYCEKGELFDANPLKKNSSLKIPLKKGLDVGKYGGYASPKTSYFAMVEFDGKKGERTRQIIGVPIYIANQLNHMPTAFVNYCEEIKEMKNVKILRDKIKKNALLVVDGFPMRIRGENDANIFFKGNLQLRVSCNVEQTIRLIEKYVQKNGDAEVSEHFDGITHEKLNEIYDCITEKLGTVYQKRPSNQTETLRKGRETFAQKMELKTKTSLINNILNFVRCDVMNKADLKAIGGSPNAGVMAVNKNTLGKRTISLVHQSVTGLYESRERL